MRKEAKERRWGAGFDALTGCDGHNAWAWGIEESILILQWEEMEHGLEMCSQLCLRRESRLHLKGSLARYTWYT